MTQDSTLLDEWPSQEKPDDYVGRHHLSHWWQWRNPTGQPFRINLKGGAFK
jgi:hypothetical protein